MRRCMLILLSFALAAQAQDAAKDPKQPPKKEAAKPAAAKDAKKPAPKPLGKNEVRVLQAVIIKVEGVAQWRPSAKGKWQKAKVNDLLSPGAELRTGRKSSVTLRVGLNATFKVDRRSRVAIPEIVQKGGVLKTRVALRYGRADVKVDRVGLDNDFAVASPSATLAVRGTAWRMWWDVNKGFRAVGVPRNKLRAIEVEWMRGRQAFLSQQDGVNEFYKDAALSAYAKSYYVPPPGYESPNLAEWQLENPGQFNRVTIDTGANVLALRGYLLQGARMGQQPPGGGMLPPPGSGDPNNPFDPRNPFFGAGNPGAPPVAGPPPP